MFDFPGAPEEIRTPDPQIRSLPHARSQEPLIPAETAAKSNFSERTGFPLQTERHCSRLMERHRRSRVSAPPAVSPCGASVVTVHDAVANRTEIPMKLTDTQLVLLSAASQREDCAIEIAPNLKGGAARKVVGKLLTEGLVEEVQACGSLPIWRRDDDRGPLALRITRGGLAAIRVDEGNTPAEAEGTRDTKQGTDLAPHKSSRRVAAARRKGSGDESPDSQPSPAGGIRSRPR